MSAVRAAKRVSIAWSGDDAFEDTSTLVLTVNGWSLDLRVFIDGAEAGTIDWSTVARVRELEGSTADAPMLRWDHLIDSRPPTEMPDEGKFNSLDNGDVEEHGTMFNPKTGKYEVYIEVWRRYPAEPGPYCVLERQGGGAYLGRVGDRALGLCSGPGGGYAAWRDELREGQWKRLESFDGDTLPALPINMPSSWTAGATVSLGDAEWIIHTIGHT